MTLHEIISYICFILVIFACSMGVYYEIRIAPMKLKRKPKYVWLKCIAFSIVFLYIGHVLNFVH